MAEYVTLPLWTDAYLADTTHLTTIEHGAYLLLLIAAWRNQKNDCALPDDDKLLARYARLTPGQWGRISETIRAFFEVRDGKLYQSRLTDEVNAVRQNSKRQSDKAKARWLKNKDSGDAVAMPDECQDDASLTLTLTHTSPIVPKGTVYTVSFEVFWAAYPHKVGKRAAFNAWQKAIKRANPIDITNGVKRYVETKPNDRAWCNPATFLNQDRWLDGTGNGPLSLSPDEVVEKWVSRLTKFAKTGEWPEFFGPKPGEPGCSVPVAAIERVKFKQEEPHD